MSSVLRRNAFQPATVRPMVGDTKTSMVRNDHIGWLVCDGRSLSVVEYRALFNVLGYEFGSDDPSTFKLPNAQGRVMGLIGMAEGVSPARNWVDGDVSGEEVHTLTIAELPAHNHDISGGSESDANGVDPSATGITSAELTGITLDPSGSHFHTGTTDISGSHTHDVNWTTVDDRNFSGTVPAIPNSDTGTVQAAYSGIVVNAGAHAHTFTTSTQPNHNHTLTDPKHRHTIASNGLGLPHNTMQPTLFLGNLFIYGGLITKNITGPDGVTPPASNRSYYPPAHPSVRLY